MDDIVFSIEYDRLGHAIQSAIVHEINVMGNAGTSPKHLRVGINLQRRDQGSIVNLLIQKGVITDDEVKEAILEGLREELSEMSAKFPGITFA